MSFKMSVFLRFKPHTILWRCIPIAFIPILLDYRSGFDLQLHDTYYVIATIHIGILSCLIFGSSGFVYMKLQGYKLNSALSVVHIVLMVLSLITITVLTIWQTLGRTGDINFDIFETMNSIGMTAVILFLLVQVLFLFNIMIGLLRGRK